MQLLLLPDRRTTELSEIHQVLLDYFGGQGPFWRPDPVSQLVLSFLGSRTRGEVSLAAFERLLDRFGNWDAVREAPEMDILDCIGDVTYAEDKAIRLKATLQTIRYANGHLSLQCLSDLSAAQAMNWLRRLPGVGAKVAAATLNFSTLRKAVMVIDTHHLRVLQRFGIAGQKADIDHAFELIMPMLPAQWGADEMDEHHALVKKLGQTLCRHQAAACSQCPIRRNCRKIGLPSTGTAEAAVYGNYLVSPG